MLTVFLATRNRAAILERVLTAFAALEAPASGWKLVVVDNDSGDRTPEILAEFEHRLPLVHVHEATLGKNAALNTGLSYLQGDLAVFTDDDVLPRPDWLVHLRKAADANPACSIFGGTVVPHWDAPPPPWIKSVHLAAVFAVTDPAPSGPTPAGTVFGPNMAIRAEIFRSGIRFDPTIGPRGASYPMGSEADLLMRLEKQGHLAFHVQDAVVEHIIRPNQVDKRWILQRAVRFGRGQYRLHGPEEVDAWPLFLVPRMVRRLGRIAKAAVTRNEHEMFCARWELNVHWGHFVEAHLARRRTAAEAREAEQLRAARDEQLTPSRRSSH